MTNTASETGREGLVGQAGSQLEDAAATAQQKASKLNEQGRSKLSETLDERTTQAGGKETAGDAVERGKQGAQDATETAKESGRDQSQELASNLQDRVQEPAGNSSQSAPAQ